MHPLNGIELKNTSKLHLIKARQMLTAAYAGDADSDLSP
jgi:hypothetical protein